MRRRHFLLCLSAGGAAWSLPSLSQTGGGAMRRIGVLANNPPSMPVAAPLYAAFYAGLNERGWVEGRNLLIEGRYAAGHTQRFGEFAAELAALDVEVIVVLGGTQATQAAKQATSKIPIVFASISNPIESGFITSFARPGGNLTGVSSQLGDLAAEKFVELLRSFAPNLERVGLIWQPANSGSAQGQKDLDAAAPRLGLSVVSIPLHTPGDVERVFATVREMRPQALVIHPTPIVGRVYKEIAAFAIAERLPTITGNSAFAREGLLMSYGPDWAAQWRLAAHYTDQLLRGAKAAELPVQQPTKFELVLNLRTARALGMEPPDTLLARADEVIE
jgi:putative tryptophan/tyrosine transport system substrate-binding protein